MEQPSLPTTVVLSAGPGRRVPTWPDWGDRRTWKLGLVQGGGSAIYFATNTFLPGYLHAIGSPGLVGPALAALNISQLPASFLLLALSRHLMGRRWPLLSAGCVLLVATAALVVSPAPLLLVPVIAIGFCGALSLLMTLALPALWTSAEDVPRLSAGMFTIGYVLAFFLPLLGGIASDATGSAAVALAPGLLAAVVVVAVSSRYPRRLGPVTEASAPASVG